MEKNKRTNLDFNATTKINFFFSILNCYFNNYFSFSSLILEVLDVDCIAIDSDQNRSSCRDVVMVDLQLVHDHLGDTVL
jgi:hypothetical protein